MLLFDRASLDSLVYLFREGWSAESMVESYPSLTLDLLSRIATRFCYQHLLIAIRAMISHKAWRNEGVEYKNRSLPSSPPEFLARAGA